MNIKNIIITIVVVYFATSRIYSQNSNIPIDTWQDHLSYYYTHNVCQVEDRILVACQSALFYHDPKTKTNQKLTKVNGLSDAGIGVINYDTLSKATVITYENSNIDILHNNIVYNIPDIKNRNIEGSKAINHIYFDNYKAYLSCGFGIVVLDLQRHEIYDTWYLGENSSAIKVNCIYINNEYIYAGTVNGLLFADKKSKTLASSSSWQKEELSDNSNQEILFIEPLRQKELLISIKWYDANNSTIIRYKDHIKDTISDAVYSTHIKRCKDRIGIKFWQTISIYDTNMNTITYYSDEWNPVSNIKLNIMDFVFDDNDLWISHEYAGLLHIGDYSKGDGSNSYTTFPNGPMTNDVYSITANKNGKMYIAPGGRNRVYENRYLKADVYMYDNHYWSNMIYADSITESMDVLNVTIDPQDENHLMIGTWWDGILEAKGDTIINKYDITNTDSMLVPNDYNYRISGIEYDLSGNLIIASSSCPYSLVYLNYHGYWGHFYTFSFLSNKEITGMLLDNTEFYKLFFTSDNHIAVINNNGDMAWIDPNNGSLLTTGQINCMTQDKDGEIWIGTEKGIKVIYSLYGALDNPNGVSNIQCSNIVYTEGDVAQYLLSFENITCIMIDGANRKWIGTERNGIYVLSPNGDKELYHFTLENSPLFSNNIICMEQNILTGEVFIGTDRGLISYRAQSLEPATSKQELIAFPNPVRENYEGLIAIKGLVDDSDVRITDINGRIVAHLKSLGGQVVWDSKNFNGQKVGSGIYFIFASSKEGTVTATGKIMIMR